MNHFFYEFSSKKKRNFALQSFQTPAHNGPSSRPLYSRFPPPLPPIPHPLPPIPHPLSPYPRPPCHPPLSVMFCCSVICVLSSFAISLMGKRELVAFLCLSSWCLVAVSALWLFLTLPWVGLQCVVVVFPIHTHALGVNVSFYTIVQWKTRCIFMDPFKNGPTSHFSITITENTENIKYVQTAISCYRTDLTNLSLMEFPVLIIWTNPFQILG